MLWLIMLYDEPERHIPNWEVLAYLYIAFQSPVVVRTKLVYEHAYQAAIG